MWCFSIETWIMFYDYHYGLHKSVVSPLRMVYHQPKYVFQIEGMSHLSAQHVAGYTVKKEQITSKLQKELKPSRMMECTGYL